MNNKEDAVKITANLIDLIFYRNSLLGKNDTQDELCQLDIVINRLYIKLEDIVGKDNMPIRIK